MIPEASRWEELRSNWPYLLTLTPLLAEWARDRWLEGGWGRLALDTLVSLLTLAMVIVIQAQRRALQESSITDKLTGFFNSRHLRAELDRQIALAQRVHSPLSMIFIDMDDFKSFNDRYGHAMGDQLLRRFAQELLGAVREHVDLCFRFGGDEFLILCPHTNIDEALIVARRAFQSPVALPEIEGEKISLSLSVAQLREGEGPREFLERADRMLYRAKKSGKNRISIEEPRVSAPDRGRRERPDR